MLKPIIIQNANLSVLGPREPAEYGSCWVREGWVCVGHVDFMLFVSIFFVHAGYLMRTRFLVEYGLKASGPSCSAMFSIK